MSGPAADGYGFTMAGVIRKHLAAREGLAIIDSSKDPTERGDVSVEPAGIVDPGEDTMTPNTTFFLVEERVGVRCGLASGDDDPGALSLIDILAEVRRALSRSGYVNAVFEFDALSQQEAGSKKVYVGGLTVVAQSNAFIG